MYYELPNYGYLFVKWWFIGFPKKLVRSGVNVLKLFNNDFSLTLNIKLLFVPLFNDYTLVGRFIGVLVRLSFIFLSLPISIVLMLLVLIMPVFWLVMPILLVYYMSYWFLLTPFVLFGLWYFFSKNLAVTTIAKTSESNYLNAFRPNVLKHLNGFGSGSTYLSRFFNDAQISTLLSKLEISSPALVSALSSSISKSLVQSLSREAYTYAKSTGTRYVEAEHLFVVLFKSLPNADIVLSSLGLKVEYIESLVSGVLLYRERKETCHFWQDEYVVPQMGGVNRTLTGRVTKYLDSFSTDVTTEAMGNKYNKFVAHAKELETVAQLLDSHSNANVLILGEPGSGKSFLVGALANEILHGTKYEGLKFKRIVRVDAGSLVAGASSPAAIAERIKNIMEDVQGSQNIILFLDEFHELLTTGGGENDMGTIFSILSPYLESSNHFVATTDLAHYRKYIEGNGTFTRLFNTVELSEVSVKDTLKVLEGFALDLEREYDVTITYMALVKTVELSKKLIHDKVFPDKAVKMLRRTVLKADKGARITSTEVEQEISTFTHVPVTDVSSDESAKLLTIEDSMKKMVIGQDFAVAKVAKSLQRARMGIRDETKPIASFLFVGTTGVGKTQTARALAQNYFGGVASMIRLDMSEYQQIDSMDRLIGSPDGSTRGLLTDAVRSRPFALVLLDEIEKAHPNILMAFLQVLDEGRLTDSVGTTVDFTNTIIIATSNVGSLELQKLSEETNFNILEEKALLAVRSKFAPEFINRFSGVIVFKPLSKDAIKAIVGIELQRVTNLAQDKGVNITYTSELISEIAARGFDSKYGARPIARVIEDSVESYLAVKLLSKEITMGDSVTLGIEVFE
ncbi:MAG: ATP-dependent Clp protease ATP-binding subunit [Patescibacteria group bacterium]